MRNHLRLPRPGPDPGTVETSRRRSVATAIVTTLAAGSLLLGTVAAENTGGPELGGSDSLYGAAPPAVAGYFPMSYPGQTILPSATVDTTANTVTFPLYKGAMRDGRTVWYVLTDASDHATAARLGLNWSPKLRNAPDDVVRTATMAEDGSLVFDQGTVDFSPERVVTPGTAPDFFPPAAAEPGSIGDADYSPLVRVTNRGGVVFNATMVAFDVEAAEIEFSGGGIDYSKVIDRAVAISPAEGTVTFAMNLATASGRPVLFISLDSNNPLLSALESTTYAPRLEALPVGTNDRPDSAVAANYIIQNGPTGADNPQRQGLNSALGDQGAQVLDIFSTVPGLVNDEAYTPMWDLYVATWTDAAIDQGYRSVLHGELEVLGMAARGWITAPDGTPLGASGLVSNCPVLMRF